MAIKTILFDLDGTLCNTLEDLAVAANWVLNQHGFPSRPTENYRYYVGNGAKVQLKRAIGKEIPPELFQKIHEDYIAYYGNHYLVHTCPYPGLPAVLQNFYNQGITMAVVTNKPQQMAVNIVQELFGNLLKGVWGNNPNFPLKPDPALPLHVMGQLGAKKEETLFVGDSAVDIETARNCGIASVGVAWGFRGREELAQAGADHIIDTPEELQNVVLA